MLRNWSLFLQMQSGLLPEATTMVDAGGSSGSLVVGPSPEETYRLAQMYEGPFVVATLPDTDMHDLPYDNGAFRNVFSSNVLEHALSPYVALMECRRVLTQGGSAHLAMPAFAGADGGRGPFHLHCLTAEVWAELLRKCGLEVVEQHEQRGHVDPSVAYHVFHCRAVPPPPPHDRMLCALQRWVSDGRPSLP